MLIEKQRRTCPELERRGKLKGKQKNPLRVNMLARVEKLGGLKKQQQNL